MALVRDNTNQGHSYLLSILNSGVIPAQAGIVMLKILNQVGNDEPYYLEPNILL